MLICALLTGLVILLLGYGRLPVWALVALAGGGALPLLLAHRHDEGATAFSVDRWAQRSRLALLSPGVRLGGCAWLLLLCITARAPWVGPVIALLVLGLAVRAGGVPLSQCLALLSLPGSFLLLSALVLLFDLSPAPLGLLDLPFFGLWLCLTPASQTATLLVLSRSVGAVGCLVALSLSMPLPELIDTLRRLRLPKVVIEVMFLLYRYLFLLLETQQSLSTAVRARLGGGLRALTGVSANLLALSFRRASDAFDAMEARCYEGELRFLTALPRRTPRAAVGALGLLAALTLLLWWGQGGVSLWR